MNKKILFLAGALTLGSNGYAGVYTVSYDVTAPGTPAVTPGNPGAGGTSVQGAGTIYSVPIPKWDASVVPNPLSENLVLVGVSYTMTTIFYGTYLGSYTKLGGTPGTATMNFDFTPAVFAFFGPANPTPDVDNDIPLLNVVASNFGGTVATQRIRVSVPGLTAGTTTSGTTTTKATTAAVTADEDVANVGLYVGTGTVDLSFIQEVTLAANTSSLTGGGTPTVSFTSTAFSSSLITVTYTYVPETGTVAGAGALVLGIGAVGWRRRRQ